MRLLSPYCINDKRELLEKIEYMQENLRGVELDKIIKRVNVGGEIIIRRDNDRSIVLFYRPGQRFPINISYIEKGKGILVELKINYELFESRVIVKYEGDIDGFVALRYGASLLDIIIINRVLLERGIDPEKYLKCVKEGEFKEANPYRILHRLKELINKAVYV